MEVFMKKYIFIIVQFLLYSICINAGNMESFNQFKNFTMRMSITPAGYSYVIISGNKNKYDSQLNVGNYLSFMPSRYASLNTYEFLSDVLKKDFKIIEINKKGKIKELTKTIKYHPSNFFSNYQKGVLEDRAEVKGLGIVAAGVVNTEAGEYKTTTYGNKGISGSVNSSGALSLLNLAFVPTNSAFYIKKISETEIVWSPNKDYNNIYYTFNIENNKVISKNRKGETFFTLFREGNSLFLNYEKTNLEFKVNEELSQFEYYENGKLKKFYKYQII